MLRDELKKLETPTSHPCVSILLPTHRNSPDNKKDPIRLKNLVNQAKEKLAGYSGGNGNGLKEKIDALASGIDHIHTLDGLGIFVSQEVAKLIHFPFRVEERAIVDDTFLVRELLYGVNRQIQYWVLVLSEQQTRLFEGAGEMLKEVKNDNFPYTFKQDKEYPQPPSPYGVDESDFNNQTRKRFLREVDQRLAPYLKHAPFPCFVLSTTKNLGYFEAITHFKARLTGHVTGNYIDLAPHQITEKVWPEVKRYRQQREQELLHTIQEAYGKGAVAAGMKDVWRATMEGRGRHLVVERGYHRPGYLREDEPMNIYLNEPPLGQSNEAKKLEDCVDDVAELVLEKDGHVTFTEDSTLRKFKHIALLLRY